MVQHECRFDEVVVEEADESGLLRAGMKVLVPCSCGETPLDNLEFMESRLDEMQAALLGYEPVRPLYHWAPVSRRKQIIRYGLRPGMRTCTATESMGAMAVCFADSPSWAWALSGSMGWTPDGEWDLWQTWQDRLQDPIIIPPYPGADRPSGIYEVRTEHRVYKRDLWLVGSRIKEAA